MVKGFIESSCPGATETRGGKKSIQTIFTFCAITLIRAVMMHWSSFHHGILHSGWSFTNTPHQINLCHLQNQGLSRKQMAVKLMWMTDCWQHPTSVKSQCVNHLRGKWKPTGGEQVSLFLYGYISAQVDECPKGIVWKSKVTNAWWIHSKELNAERNTAEHHNSDLSAAQLGQDSEVPVRTEKLMRREGREEKAERKAAAEIWLLSDNVKRKLNNAETRQ